MAMRILPLTALLLAVGAAPATAAASPLAGSPAAVVKVNQARFGGARGFGRSTYRSRPRYTPATRFRARPHLGRHLFRGVLQALGIAYLAHLLFGVGAGGGSPLGLLIVLGLLLWMATRRRRRLAYQRW
jgi:hypothetical protein